MYVEILHCRMWEAERKQIKYLYLAAAIMPAVSSPATLTLVIISVRLGVWGKVRSRLESSSPLSSSTI